MLKDCQCKTRHRRYSKGIDNGSVKIGFLFRRPQSGGDGAVRKKPGRSALEFIDSVKKVRMLKPVQILTGHEDIRGAEEVHAALTRIIDSVQWVHDRTVEGMNAGVDVRTLMQETETPEHLTLTEEYGKVAWNIRAIWHEYTGWYDPSRGITELYGVPFSSVAPTLIDLIGGEKELIRKANAFSDQGKPIEALHLLDIALAANPESVEGRKARGKSLSLLLEQSSGKNLWERMSISAELSDLED